MFPARPPLPALNDPASDRLVLRDGSVASIRATTPADREALRRFFHELSPESRQRRFFTPSEPGDRLIDRFSDSSDPRSNLTLIALRQFEDGERPIAVATYSATGHALAEAAFAVADDFQGKGLGTVLLERLASIGAGSGFCCFEASALAENQSMLEVFRDSGFEVRSKSAMGVVEVRLDLSPSASGLAAINERNRAATVASLEPILRPGAVAVIGASRDRSRFGRRVFDAMRQAGFTGPVYPVNSAAESIDGHRTFASARELPPGVDLAVVAVPRDSVAGVVEDCAAAGVKSLVVITAGFAETDPEGAARQQQLVSRARGHGMRLVGPNCMGVLNTDPAIRLNASFSLQMPPRGRIALASQSGGLALAILQLAEARGAGVSTFVSLGNKADVSGNDLIQYGERDPETSVILLYLESFGNPRRFAQLAPRVGRSKPIVVVKAGRTPAGKRAAGSHTAGLQSNDTAVEALFRQTGVIRAGTIDEMFDIATCLDQQALPTGGRLAIITNAGGPAIMAADACDAAGLIVTELQPATRARLAAHLPAKASLNNPVDLIASAGPDRFRAAITALLPADEVDALLVIYTPLETTPSAEILDAIGTAVADARTAGITSKPVLACTMTPSGRLMPLHAGAERIPVYAFPENAVRALGRVNQYARWRAEPPGMFWGFENARPDDARALCREIIRTRGDSWLTGEEVSHVLGAFGVPLLVSLHVRSADEAAEAASRVGYPVVLKVNSLEVLHKSDVGGVKANLGDERAVRDAFSDLATRFPAIAAAGRTDSVTVQPMLHGAEILIGLTEDPVFGALVAFGLGGTDAEVFRDVGFRIAPLTDRDADDLIHGIRSFPLLTGYRGRPNTDLEALREVLLRVSLIGQHVPEILELDLNPVIALPQGQGCRVVDARVRIGATR
jgi:acetyl coenzyme A synthetase (ADP forming)-like protein